MSAAVKNRDWSHTSRENNPSFPLDLLLEGLIKEEKQLWLSARFSCIVSQFHFLGYVIRLWEVPPAFSSGFEVLAGKFTPPHWGRSCLGVCAFPGRSVGITLGQICGGFPFQDLGFHQEERIWSFCPWWAGVYLVIFSSKTKSSCLT